MRSPFLLSICVFTLSVPVVHAYRPFFGDEINDADTRVATERQKEYDKEQAEIARQLKEQKEKDLKAAEENEEKNANKIFCAALQKAFKSAMDPLPLADWINTSQLDSFYQTNFHRILSQEKYFNSINTLEQYNLVLEPYGFQSSFSLEDKDYSLTTFGATLAGSMTLKDVWVVGGGVGYWHSALDWDRYAKGTTINSFYFGPQATYLFHEGFVQLLIAGVFNMYDVHRDMIKNQKSSNEHNGWDILARLSGGMDFKVPLFGDHTFFMRPYADLSYLGVIQDDYDEKTTKRINPVKTVDAEAKIKNGYTDFFRSKLAVEMWKEFHFTDTGFFIPSLTIGWVSMQPIRQGKIQLDCEDDKEIEGNKYPSSNLLNVGAKLTGIHKRGILLSLGFDADQGEIYPVYRGNIRFEIDW
ncbi:MAG: autotransporter domain-containing protein [Verrucomicrobia bacterium]|nr:autotransporter domain-containing protein [Verrucomicrobiota bacterium]